LHLSRRAAILASLIGRACGEILAVNGNAGNRIRQTQNTWLRRNQLWDSLEPDELSLMSRAEATWTQAERDSVVVWCEQLRLLRWVLGIDSELMPLEHFPHPDPRLAEGLKGLPCGNAKKVNTWDVRIERDKAAHYEARLLAEFSARNLLPANPELDTWADELRNRLTGSSTDYLAGAKTISDLDDASLKLLGAVTVARVHYTSWLLEQLSEDTLFSFSEWINRSIVSQ
jgi:hypothetical protein